MLRRAAPRGLEPDVRRVASALKPALTIARPGRAAETTVADTNREGV
jgi:hypothetical protein